MWWDVGLSNEIGHAYRSVKEACLLLDIIGMDRTYTSPHNLSEWREIKTVENGCASVKAKLNPLKRRHVSWIVSSEPDADWSLTSFGWVLFSSLYSFTLRWRSGALQLSPEGALENPNTPVYFAYISQRKGQILRRKDALTILRLVDNRNVRGKCLKNFEVSR